MRGGRREELRLLLRSCRWMVRSDSPCLQFAENCLGSVDHALRLLSLLLLKLRMRSVGLTVLRDWWLKIHCCLSVMLSDLMLSSVARDCSK